ncbi:MAG: glycosyltransferase family 2 protein [Candidatus Lokiarchaeota archaeon]|nr:glycosyltransferase family 2 protein [Candidatus Lokiarchaeota archaeon]
MTEIILSICIPTYNRSNILKETISHLIKCKRDDIEIVICDNASPDRTEIIVKEFEDSRIKYYKNLLNYGVDMNILKCIERAKGEFIYFITDEDIINLDLIPWIINLIKTKKELNMIIGTVLDKRNGINKIMYPFGNHIYKPGPQAILNLFFKEGYLAGIIIKRDSVDINLAKKYIGCIYIHQVLMLQAMKKGYSMTSSKIFCYIPDRELISEIYMFKDYCKNKPYFSPLGTFSQLEDRYQIIDEILSEYPQIQLILRNREYKKWADVLARTIFMSPKSFIVENHKIIKILNKNKNIIKTHIFLIEFFKKFIKYLFSVKFWRNKIFRLN